MVFAGAVGTDEAEDLPFGDVDSCPPARPRAPAVGLAQPLDGDAGQTLHPVGHNISYLPASHASTSAACFDSLAGFDNLPRRVAIARAPGRSRSRAQWVARGQAGVGHLIGDQLGAFADTERSF